MFSGLYEDENGCIGSSEVEIKNDHYTTQPVATSMCSLFEEKNAKFSKLNSNNKNKLLLRPIFFFRIIICGMGAY